MRPNSNELSVPRVEVAPRCSGSGCGTTFLAVATVPRSGRVVPPACRLCWRLLLSCSSRFVRAPLPGLPGTPKPLVLGTAKHKRRVKFIASSTRLGFLPLGGRMFMEALLVHSLLGWLGKRHVSCAMGLVMLGRAYIPPIWGLPIKLLMPIFSILPTRLCGQIVQLNLI